MRTLILAPLLTGCITATAVPTAMHPTAADTETSVGVAVGGAYYTQSNSTSQQSTKLLTIPYGEGVIHHPLSTGQLGVHLAPNVVYGSYRYDVMKLGDGIGLAI